MTYTASVLVIVAAGVAACSALPEQAAIDNPVCLFLCFAETQETVVNGPRAATQTTTVSGGTQTLSPPRLGVADAVNP